jgi:hypothetical protein
MWVYSCCPISLFLPACPQAIEARMSRCGEVVEGAPRRHWGPAHGPDHDGGL